MKVISRCFVAPEHNVSHLFTTCNIPCIVYLVFCTFDIFIYTSLLSSHLIEQFIMTTTSMMSVIRKCTWSNSWFEYMCVANDVRVIN